MKKILILIVAILLVAGLFTGFVPGQVTQALAYDGDKGCENGNGNKKGCDEVIVTEDGGGDSGQLPIGGNAGPVDPCVAAGNCGNGDHGKGDPTNGSLHANCRAAQGEVDPNCPAGGTPPPVIVTPPPATGTPAPTSTPNPTGTPEPEDGGEETPTIVIDGEEIPFVLKPYKAPDGNKITGKPVVVDCPQDCCCECQSLDWLKPWMIFAFLGVLGVIALALVALVLIKIFGRWLFLLSLVAITPIAIFVAIRLVG